MITIFKVCFLWLIFDFFAYGISFDDEEHKLYGFYRSLPSSLQYAVTVYNKGREIHSLSGDIHAKRKIEFEPTNEQQIIDMISFVANNPNRKIIVGAGNYEISPDCFQGLSIGPHAHGEEEDIYLSTRKLKTTKLEISDYMTFPEDNTIIVTVKAGNSWREVIELANNTLTEKEKKEYLYVPFSVPTSDMISVGGTLATHGHSRTTAFGGGYMPDSVLSFSLITIKDDQVVQLEVNHEENKELFYCVPGSYGKVGIITKLSLRLQRIPKKSRVVTEIKRYTDIDKLVNNFDDKIEEIKQNILPIQRPFNSVYVTASDNGYFYLWTSKLLPHKESKNFPYFQFFEGSSKTNFLIQDMAHNSPKLANIIMDKVITGIREQKTYKNHPITWIFSQDSWIDYSSKYQKTHNDHLLWAHQAYVLPRKFLSHVIKIAKDIQREYRYRYKLICKMEDIVPLIPSRFLMAPAFNAESDLYIYTFTWPIKNAEQREATAKFREQFLQACDDSHDIGANIVNVHMLKEFDTKSPLVNNNYQNQSEILAYFLDKNHINDSFLWNKMFEGVYHISHNKARY